MSAIGYFQGVVTDYLRANRATFVNTECCIQLNEGANPDTSGPHWYCDAVAIYLPLHETYLCEVSYAKGLGALGRRLSAWAEHWRQVRAALTRDCGIGADWSVQPWVFVPSDLKHQFSKLTAKIPIGAAPNQMPVPKVTTLEEVLPWKYPSWNREHHGNE